MRMRQPAAALLLAALLALPACLAAPARAESPSPAPAGDAFPAALAADALSLAPLPLPLQMTGEETARQARRQDEALASLGMAGAFEPPLFPSGETKPGDFYASVRLLSLSPDGGQALAESGGGLWLLALASGQARAVVPEAGFREPGQVENWQRVSRNVETQSLSWSPDGASLLVSSPRAVLTMLRLGTNVFLIDVKAASARPLFPGLPAALGLTDGAPAGLPLRAAFGPDGRLVFVETLFPGGDGLRGEIQAVDPATGVSARVADFNPLMAVTDGRLWATADAFLQVTAQSGGQDAAGLLVTGFSGERRLITYARPFREQYWPSLSLAGTAGGMALLRTDFTRFAATPQPALLHLADPGAQDAVLDETLALNEGAAPAERLLRLPAAELMAGAPEGVTVPDNGALSPDGRLLLLAVRDRDRRNPRLYLHDFSTGLTGRVALPPETRRDPFFAFFMPPMSDFAAGIQWAGGNRLLLWADGAYRAYEFSPAP